MPNTRQAKNETPSEPLPLLQIVAASCYAAAAVCYIDKGESRPVSRNLRKLYVLAGCGSVPNE